MAQIQYGAPVKLASWGRPAASGERVAPPKPILVAPTIPAPVTAAAAAPTAARPPTPGMVEAVRENRAPPEQSIAAWSSTVARESAARAREAPPVGYPYPDDPYHSLDSLLPEPPTGGERFGGLYADGATTKTPRQAHEADGSDLWNWLVWRRRVAGDGALSKKEQRFFDADANRETPGNLFSDALAVASFVFPVAAVANVALLSPTEEGRELATEVVIPNAIAGASVGAAAGLAIVGGAGIAGAAAAGLSQAASQVATAAASAAPSPTPTPSPSAPTAPVPAPTPAPTPAAIPPLASGLLAELEAFLRWIFDSLFGRAAT